MSKTHLKVLDNGPILIEGDWDLVDGSGKVVTSNEKTPQVALCRCGASGKKPHCDGTHKKIHFDSKI